MPMIWEPITMSSGTDTLYIKALQQQVDTSPTVDSGIYTASVSDLILKIRQPGFIKRWLRINKKNAQIEYQSEIYTISQIEDKRAYAILHCDVGDA